MSAVAPERADLEEPRHVGELMRLTFELFARHWFVFAASALLVVTPAVMLVDGLWGGQFADGADAAPGTAAEAASWIVTTVTAPALVTALHCSLVRDIGAGRRPSLPGALRAVAPRALPVLAVVAAHSALVVAGLVALVAPGVWIGVLLYFGAQVVVLEGIGPLAALRRSAALVRGRWWATFGALLLSGFAFTLIGGAVGLLVLPSVAPLPYVVLHIVVQSLLLSLSALFGTLLFFATRGPADARA